jgi:hypothetical protein
VEEGGTERRESNRNEEREIEEKRESRDIYRFEDRQSYESPWKRYN